MITKTKILSKIFFFAITPTLYAGIIAMLFSIFTITYPNISTLEGKLLPKDFIAPGSIVAVDDTTTQSQNYTLTFPNVGDFTTVFVWDYARIDGDRISILIDGQTLGNDISLTRAIQTLRVPKNSSISIVGTFDGGGGITYGVHFPEINKTIINGVAASEINTFTLNKKN